MLLDLRSLWESFVAPPSGTTWTELSAPATSYIMGFMSATSGTEDAYVMFGLLLPEEGFTQFIDATTSYTELSIGATSSTELTAPSTPWTELTG